MSVNGLGFPSEINDTESPLGDDPLRDKLDSIERRLEKIEADQQRFYRDPDGWERVIRLEQATRAQHAPQPQPVQYLPAPVVAPSQPGWNLGTQMKESAGITIPVGVVLVLLEVVRAWMTTG